jgi:hypothetical protein
MGDGSSGKENQRRARDGLKTDRGRTETLSPCNPEANKRILANAKNNDAVWDDEEEPYIK